MSTRDADACRWFDNRIFSSILLAAALFWLGKLTWDNLDQLAETAGSFPYGNFLGALVPAMVALFTASVTHCFILAETSGRAISFSSCIPYYLISQIVRYIPGKIWGIFYQARQLASQVGSREVWAANFVQLAIGTAASAIAVAWAASLVFFDAWTAFVTLAVLVIALYLSLWQKWIHHTVRRLTPTAFRSTPSLPVDQSIEIFLSLLVEWAAYLLSWVILLYGTHSPGDAVVISILYVASWILGFAVTVVPGGIGIREGTFVSLGGVLGFNPGMLMFYALLARLLFTLADLINGILAYVFVKTHQSRT